ncbi:MAG TPA: carbohydrate kinase [Clostridiales bacterium]|nr:carbohydrate kinase [Clostridiales bacterium]
MFDVTAIGELLIDFTPAGHSAQNRPLFEQNPGGGPANALACLSRLGCTTAFIGKVGADQFGYSLKAAMDQLGISTRGLVMTSSCHTSLAFVHLDERGERTFSFYRNPGADLLLEPSELSYNLIDDCRIFHFGAVSMTADPARQATLTAVRYAREQGKLISFDPNLRLPLWATEEIARQVILQAIPLADVLKISEEELVFLTGETDMVRGADSILRQNSLKLVLVTMGPRGAYARAASCEAWRPAYDVRTIDTTGAGDAFTGSFLYQILQSGKTVQSLTEDDLTAFLAFSNACGSLTTTRRGGFPAMPTLSEVEACLTGVPTLD